MNLAQMNSRKLEFLQRFDQVLGATNELLDFLYKSKAISEFEMNTFKSEKTISKWKFLLAILNKQEKEEKIVFLEMQWILLPFEVVKFTITTSMDHKSWSYNE